MPFCVSGDQQDPGYFALFSSSFASFSSFLPLRVFVERRLKKFGGAGRLRMGSSNKSSGVLFSPFFWFLQAMPTPFLFFNEISGFLSGMLGYLHRELEDMAWCVSCTFKTSETLPTERMNRAPSFPFLSSFSCSGIALDIPPRSNCLPPFFLLFSITQFSFLYFQCPPGCLPRGTWVFFPAAPPSRRKGDNQWLKEARETMQTKKKTKWSAEAYDMRERDGKERAKKGVLGVTNSPPFLWSMASRNGQSPGTPKRRMDGKGLNALQFVGNEKKKADNGKWDGWSV
jgi:hypothetical protein